MAPGAGGHLCSVTAPCRETGEGLPPSPRHQTTGVLMRNHIGLPRHSCQVPNKAEATSSAVWREVRVVSPRPVPQHPLALGPQRGALSRLDPVKRAEQWPQAQEHHTRWGSYRPCPPTSRTPGCHLGGGSEVCPLLSARSGETIVLWVLFCDLPKMFAFATLHLLFSVAHWSPTVPGRSPHPRSGSRTALRLPNGRPFGGSCTGSGGSRSSSRGAFSVSNQVGAAPLRLGGGGLLQGDRGPSLA